MIIAVDIDGILTNETEGHDYKNRTPNQKNIDKVNDLFWIEDNTVVLYTARNEVDMHVTGEWLEEHNVRFHQIIFNKPKYHYLIDDQAFNSFEQFEKKTKSNG